MKKLVVTVICILCVILGACTAGAANMPVSYPLRSIYLDGEQIGTVEGEIILAGDGGTLTLEGHTAIFSRDGDKVLVNTLEGTLIVSDGGVTLKFPDVGLEYVFSEKAPEIISEEETPDEFLSGTPVSGRLFFTGCEDEYSDYEGRSMAVSGYELDGGYKLYAGAYSDTEPLMVIDDGGTGIFMEYDVICTVKKSTGTAGSIVERYDIAEPFKYRPWDAPSGYFDREAEEETEITAIKGNCKDSFGFEILLTADKK